MNKKLIREFLIITFAVMAVFWGGAAIISQLFDITVNNIFLRIMHLIGGFSPTIASYISLKRSGKVTGFRDWIKQIFNLKHSVGAYLAVIIFTAIYYGAGCTLSEYSIGAPIFMIIILAPMMLFGGGNEEVGWRMILQPELEKSLGSFASSLLVGIIWWLWHFPLFFIKGTANIEMNYFFFGIMCITLSFAMAAIRRLSSGVFPCVLMHCLINGFSGIFLFDYNLKLCITVLTVTLILSLIIVFIHNKQSGKKAKIKNPTKPV